VSEPRSARAAGRLCPQFGKAFGAIDSCFKPTGVTVQEISSLLTRLNLETRHCHADVDDLWLGLMSPTAGVADYTGALVRSYGLIAPFESACKYTPGLSRLVDFRYFLRAGLIAQDLIALGLTPHQVANLITCPSVTMFQSAPEALGWIYVIERSTLLHDGVRRHLLRRLPHLENACAYLAAYEAHVSDHWAAFGRVLDQAASQDPAVEDAVVESAVRAFSISRDWLRSAKNDNRETA
jgi:heme oxygenase